MRLLVCGGRNFQNRTLLFQVLDHIHTARGPVTAVIHGAYRGADTLADSWAKTRGIKPEPYPADWTAHGPAAGPIRNRQMLVEGKPDYVIAFIGDRGTQNMIDQAKAAGVPGATVGF